MVAASHTHLLPSYFRLAPGLPSAALRAACLNDYVDPRTKGKARIELRKLKRSGELGNLSTILEQEFGGGALAALREKEVALKAGIPGKDGVAFSERINMRDKLHQLEAARDYLADKCPDDLQDGYAIAKDPFLIRLVMEKVHPSYTTNGGKSNKLARASKESS